MSAAFSIPPVSFSLSLLAISIALSYSLFLFVFLSFPGPRCSSAPRTRALSPCTYILYYYYTLTCLLFTRRNAKIHHRRTGPHTRTAAPVQRRRRRRRKRLRHNDNRFRKNNRVLRESNGSVPVADRAVMTVFLVVQTVSVRSGQVRSPLQTKCLTVDVLCYLNEIVFTFMLVIRTVELYDARLRRLWAAAAGSVKNVLLIPFWP